MPTKQKTKHINSVIRDFLRQAGELPRLEHALTGLGFYFQELAEWNRVTNLTGRLELEDLVAKHLGDTLVLERWLPSRVETLLDIGTGAGIPGLILKFLRPELRVCLLDARRKRVSFLNHVIAGAALSGVYALHGRAGEGPLPDWPNVPDASGSFDIVTSQAVGSITEMARMSGAYLGAEGAAVSMKGPSGTSELDGSLEWLARHEWKAEAVKARMPVSGQLRFLIVMKKKFAGGP